VSLLVLQDYVQRILGFIVLWCSQNSIEVSQPATAVGFSVENPRGTGVRYDRDRNGGGMRATGTGLEFGRPACTVPETVLAFA
jgi:hypothetical protein